VRGRAAGDLDIRFCGGLATIRNLLLGRGVRLWDGLEGLEQRFEIKLRLVTERRHAPDLHATLGRRA
jgi:hypothetical protein